MATVILGPAKKSGGKVTVVSDEPTQTTPQGEVIPVPSKDEVMAAFRKAAKVPAARPSDVDDTK